MTSAPGKRLSPKRFFGIQIAIFLPLVTVLSIASLRSILRRFLDSADVVRLGFITISVGNVSETLFVSRHSRKRLRYFSPLLFSNVLFFFTTLFFESIPSNSLRPVFLNRSRNSTPPVSPPTLSLSLSLCVSSVKFEKRCANLSIDRNLDKVRHQAKRSYRFLDISRAISRAWSRSARETQRFVSIDLFLSPISSVNRRGRFREQCYSIDSFRAGEKEEFIIVERDNIFHFGFLLFT